MRGSPLYGIVTANTFVLAVYVMHTVQVIDPQY